MNFSFHYRVPYIVLYICVIAFITIFSSVSDANEKHLSFSAWQTIPHGQARFFKTSPPLQAPNKQYSYGIELQLEPDWHSYWHNPGDSGAAPELLGINDTQESPLAIAYPSPTRINLGPLTTYGYSGRVIYFFDMPAIYQHLRADLLICKEECIPGSISWQATDNHIEQNMHSYNREFENFVNKQLARLPKPNYLIGQYYPSMQGSRWQFKLAKNETLIDIFWYSEQVDNLHKL